MKYVKKILVSSMLLGVLSGGVSEVSAFSMSDVAQDTLDSIGISVPATEYLSRGQFAMVVMEISGNENLITAMSPFSDVPSWRADANAVGVIYQLGLLSGNGDGTFAPDRSITVGESVTALLRLLDYTSTEIGYRWPEDYVVKAQNIGLLENLPTESSSILTEDMANQLFYNLISINTKTGQVYGEQMASSVVRDVVLLSNYASNGGGVDQLSVLSNGVVYYYSKDTDLPSGLLNAGRGTLLLDSSGKAMGFLPNDEVYYQMNLASVSALGVTSQEGAFYSVPTTATLMLGENKTTFGAGYFSMETYNSVLICYGSSGTVELVIARNNVHYSDYVVTGFYEYASPNPYQPETVTTLGYTFEVDPEIASKFAQFAYGDAFHLVLGEEGEVKDVISYSPDVVAPMIGILGRTSSNVSTVTLLNGIEISGNTSNRLYAEEGQLVKITPTGIESMTVAPARNNQNDVLDLDAMKLGKYKISEDVKVFECVDHSAATALTFSDISIHQVAADQVRYYQLNSENEVEILLLNNATGDQYTYGIITNVTVRQSSSFGEITNEGAKLTTVSGDTSDTITRVFKGYDGAVGGMIWEEDGDLISGIILTATEELPRLSLIDGEYMVNDGERIPLAEDVVVYHMRLGRWISFAEAMTECETFVGHYDKTVEDGGKIRVIYAYDSN